MAKTLKQIENYSRLAKLAAVGGKARAAALSDKRICEIARLGGKSGGRGRSQLKQLR